MQEDATNLEDLPEELRQMILLKRTKKLERINSLGQIVAKKRDEAVEARKKSGIERIWKEDEEYYLGIDDLNRKGNAFTKSMSPDGGLSSSSKDSSGRATAFFNITRQFVDSASARMGDILLPSGDWNFAIKATPVPDLVKIKDSTQPVVDPATGQPKTNPDGSPYTLGQFAQQETSEANEKVERAELRIRDWLTECHYHTEVRKVLEDSAKIGTGVLRGAYPGMSKARVVIDGQLSIQEKVVPTSKHIKPEDFFPDPNCGDDIQNGSFVIEREYMSARQLRELKGMPDYIAENIEKVIKEGPGKNSRDHENIYQDGITKDDDRFQVWYFFGNIDIDDLDALGQKPSEIKDDAVPSVIVLINDTVIKGFMNPLDNGEFPYDLMPWQRMSDSPWGVGIARQGRVPQDMLNASARALMNNMGLSSAPQLIMRQSAIRPADGNYHLTAGKIWFATEEADVRTVSDAFTSVVIPSMQQDINGVIQLAYKMMEDATGVSFLLQGQQGSAPDTVGGMELLHKNSSSLLRRIARVFDECVTEPHIRRYYDWLLIHGEDEEKGDLQIEAVGSSALVEREIQAQQAAQILQMSLNPVFEMSPAKAKDELLRAWRFEPSKFAMDDEERKKMAGQQQPAPQIQAAQIRAQSAERIAQAKARSDAQMDKNDLDRDTAYNQSILNRDRMTYEARMAELNLRKELAMMDYANKHELKLEDIKARLSDSVMKLRTQKELSMASMELDAGKHDSERRNDLYKHDNPVLTPPTEPVGRAPNGRSFQA